jgi:putative redox protein
MSENVRRVRLEWQGEGMRFSGGAAEPPGPSVVIDGDGEAGPSPMQTLLLAVAACSGADVVHILGKGRVPFTSCTVEAMGVRREEDPRRYVEIQVTYRVGAAADAREKVERAAQLSVEKYCSVMHSLAKDMAISHSVELA